MRSFKFGYFIAVATVVSACCFELFAQQPPVLSPPSNSTPVEGMVLEVMFFKGEILSYQRIGDWTWYARFRRPADWKTRMGEVPVAAVRVGTRKDGGVIKARVSVLRGKNHESEDFVGEYSLFPEKKTIVGELSALGVEPFELQLVRAPATVADLPTVVNNTKSLEVSVEPMESGLPAFSIRFLNTSTKPILSLMYDASIDGRRKMSSATQDEAGKIMIKPGETFKRSFRYPLKASPISTGEVPPALSGLVLTVTSVIFSDGTYEGDSQEAAMYLAGTAGCKAQLRSFLDMLRSKEFANSEPAVQAAILSVNVESVLADFVRGFPGLTVEQKSSLRDAVEFGKSRCVKFFREVGGDPVPALTLRLRERIEALP